MDLRFFRPSGGFSLSRPRVFGVFLLLTVAALSISGAAALITTCFLGPASLASITEPWVLTFFIAVAVGIAWWILYLAVLDRLCSEGWQERPHRIIWPLAVLSTSVLPDLAVLLSGRLPYTLLFDEGGYRGFRYLAGAIVGVTVIVQELMLLTAVRGVSLARLTVDVVQRIGTAVKRVGSVPRAVVAGFPAYLPLLAILAIGAKLRLDSLNLYAYGDMDVMLSITYNILGWPPVAYYHNYVTQTWIYNHLPLFPIMLAPLYWLSEHVLHLSTAWAAKLLIGVADWVIAVVLYWQAGTGWWRVWGLVLAAMWMLTPLAVQGDDHPIPVAIAFALLGMATVERPWLSGLMFALGMATRSEVAFLALPVVVHFVTKRPLAQSVAFLGTFGTTVALIGLPFVLFDPAAMDYAMRRQLQRDAAGQLSMLSSALFPYLDQKTATFLRDNSSLMAVPFNLLLGLLAMRDRRVPRVVLVVALGYLLTLPILLDRYTLFAYAAGLFYAARYANPVVAGVVLVAEWPGFPYTWPLLIGLLVVMSILALLRQGRDAVPETLASR